MPHDHMYDCRQCGAHLDSREELEKHMREKHRVETQLAPSSSRLELQQEAPSQRNDIQQRY